MLGERRGVRLVAELVQQPCRPFYVREEERDRAGRKVVAHAA
jgi:hypothetical protein